MASSSTTALCQDTIAAIASLDGPFSCAEVREKLQSESSSLDGLTHTQARMATYYRIKRLIKEGWVQVKAGTYGPKQLYVVTEHFEVPVTAVEVDFPTDNHQQNQKQEITDKLREYHSEMLSLQGESEEYERLYQLYPDNKESYQASFQETVNAKWKLVGRIRALEKQLKRMAQ
ncbi:hypothetical protein [Ferrimonas sp. YFM]|uniref:hypothetical protein n=1 Tax=Ferrimonas sp. YFM TaxID=3028878 RepID=UPI002573DE25|nr:hypothetical protein [Ferrimonas sp. YFM]BDY07064.1 hypothetical protein F0521_41050 [Ferrimonas sp. YFM]